MRETIMLQPKDYILYNGGLKIENISEDNVITVELPNKYTIKPLIITGSTQRP